MDTAFFAALMAETLRSPAIAARRLIGAGLDTSVLWLALGLVTVLNAIFFYLSNVLFPPPESMPITGLTSNPMIYAILSGGALVISVFVLTWVGSALGGRARLADMLVLMVWLQFIGLVLQAATLVMMLVMPPLAAILYMATLVISLWLTLHFVSVAHGFNSLLRALGVIVLSVLGMSLGLSLILILLGVSAEGVSGNV